MRQTRPMNTFSHGQHITLNTALCNQLSRQLQLSSSNRSVIGGGCARTRFKSWSKSLRKTLWTNHEQQTHHTCFFQVHQQTHQDLDEVWYQPCPFELRRIIYWMSTFCSLRVFAVEVWRKKSTTSRTSTTPMLLLFDSTYLSGYR